MYSTISIIKGVYAMNILDLALSMELDLRDFYLQQARRNSGNSLEVVFRKLAKEEENHASIIRNNSDRLIIPMEDSNLLSEVKYIFRNISDFKINIKELPSQLDAYRMALDKEQESLAFYQRLLDEARTEHAKRVFTFLKDQEDHHCIILEELVKLASRPEEWVESPEFGDREY